MKKSPKSNIYVHHQTQHRKGQLKPAKMTTEDLERKEWDTAVLDTIHRQYNNHLQRDLPAPQPQPQDSVTLDRENTRIIMSSRKGHKDCMSPLGPSKHFWNEGFLLRCLTILAMCGFFFQLHAKSLALPFMLTHKQPDLDQCRASVTVQRSSSEHVPFMLHWIGAVLV